VPYRHRPEKVQRAYCLSEYTPLPAGEVGVDTDSQRLESCWNSE
jgi:hypothetical protein